jgi:hypothetical protein
MESRTAQRVGKKFTNIFSGVHTNKMVIRLPPIAIWQDRSPQNEDFFDAT